MNLSEIPLITSPVAENSTFMDPEGVFFFEMAPVTRAPKFWPLPAGSRLFSPLLN